MKRLIAVFALSCVALLSACGESSSAGADAGIEALFPADNGVAGWTQDLTVDTKAGPAVFSDLNKIDKTDIDGDVVPFNNVGFKQLARAHYKKDSYQLDLRVWEMKSAAKGEEIYTSLPNNTDKYKVLTWTDEAIGTKGRYGNSATMWRVNAYQGAFFLEATVMPSTKDDTAGRDEGIAMLKYVAGKIP